ncbi:MAG: hypothetical protein EAY72_08425 [Bacteroidetes bacterium]|nr:MAG: hypothetical protein EAY72_08425 [Bacteroidota bacterium]
MKGIWAIGALVGVVLLLQSCGNIIPPGGGPRDTLPPVLVQAFPADSSLQFNAKKIKLVFNEYIQVADIQKELLISPNIASTPTIEGKLKEVTIQLKDSLPPNTTFTLQFGNAIKDVNENNPATNFTYTFSTGKYLDSNSLSGTVLVAETGKPDTTLVALLHNNLSDTAIIKLRPDYVAKVIIKAPLALPTYPVKNSTYLCYQAITPNGTMIVANS